MKQSFTSKTQSLTKLFAHIRTQTIYNINNNRLCEVVPKNIENKT